MGPTPTRFIPWYIWAGALAAVTSASIGGQWDVAWHRSIDETRADPAYMAIYACGVIAGWSGYTLCSPPRSADLQYAAYLREASVDVFGLRAPLGVFLAGWGMAMKTGSAPFDNWWHNAYGLDVKIITPPHALLIAGIRAIDLRVLFLMLAAMNRASDAGEVRTSNIPRLLVSLSVGCC